MNEELRTMHLFAGGGGGILADLILGHRPIVAVEWDKYACDVLRARAAEGWFDGMSVWEGDVRLFDPSEYQGRVDCIHAGFPCQDISIAGGKAGVGEDTRSGLYREVLRIADILQPRYLFLENVSAIVSGDDGAMLRTVVGDLASRGYDAVWRCLSASEVGANHKRDRWWLLAYPRRELRGEGNTTKLETQEKARSSSAVHDQSGRQGQYQNVANTQRIRLQGSWESEQSKHPKTQGDGQANHAVNGSWWEAEPNVGRVDNGVAYASHRLKALGNGQVPLQCATAFKLLWEEHNAIKTASRKGGADAKGITR